MGRAATRHPRAATRSRGGIAMTIEDQAPDSFRQDSSSGPELKRTLGPFQVFAISFASLSVAGRVVGTYDYVLQNSGPVGIWLWVLSAAGQMLIALVGAQ